MAIVHQGALTSGIRGKVGDVVFQHVNGVQVVRQMPPSIQDPNTPLQQIQRTALTQAMVAWRSMDIGERAKWELQALLRVNRNKHKARRRVEDQVKAMDDKFFDGHNAVVAQKCREADRARGHEGVNPVATPIQDPPVYEKTKNLPPYHVAIVVAVGSLGAVWNLLNPLVDYDGLWWFMKRVFTPSPGSRPRVWTQPPYPIHRQRITTHDGTTPDPWGSYISAAYNYRAWAWKCQVKGLTIRIVEPAPWAGVATVGIPYVWKSQLDGVDSKFRETNGSAVVRFYLPAGLGEGLWQVWPTFVDLLGVEGAGTFEHPEAMEEDF